MKSKLIAILLLAGCASCARAAAHFGDGYIGRRRRSWLPRLRPRRWWLMCHRLPASALRGWAVTGIRRLVIGRGTQATGPGRLTPAPYGRPHATTAAAITPVIGNTAIGAASYFARKESKGL
jgi:hypothetical protein